MYVAGERPRFYVFKYNKVSYVLIDLEGRSTKESLEKIINEHVGKGLKTSQRSGKVYNPYPYLERAMERIRMQYGMVVIKNPTELELNQSLKKAIQLYNSTVSNL